LKKDRLKLVREKAKNPENLRRINSACAPFTFYFYYSWKVYNSHKVFFYVSRAKLFIGQAHYPDALVIHGG
jgi:hypothetical protein